MPTGYTTDVADGKITDFRSFALLCARAFGACIMQRDDPMKDAPKLREVSEYEINRVEETLAEMRRLAILSVEQAEIEMQAERQEVDAANARYQQNKTAQRNRYNAMLTEVIAWQPPTPDHAEMKKFMIDQLTESRKFDCSDYQRPAPPGKTAAEWLSAKRQSSIEEYDRATIRLGEERDRVAKANAWIEALYQSLPFEKLK